MSKLNSKNVESFHPILPEVFTSEAITFDLSNFQPRNPSKVLTTNVLDIYKIFHNICYYICVMPFKIMYDDAGESNRTITFNESKVQKGICIVLHVARFFHALPPLFGSLQGKHIHIDPSQFYHLIASLTSFSMVMAFSVVCMRQSRLKSFLTHLFDFRQPNGQHNRSKITYPLMLIPITLIVFYTISYQKDKLKFSSWMDFAESGAQEMGTHYQFWDTPSTSELMSQNWTTPEMNGFVMTGKLVLTSIHLLLIIFEYSLAIFLEVMVFIICFSVYQIGYDFWDGITEDQNSMNLEKLRQCYQEMKSLMDELNWTFGYQILFFMVATIPYYGVHLIEIFNGPWFQRIETIYFMLLYSVTLLLAAEGHRKFQQFPEFIFDNHKQIERGNHEELSIFINDVTNSKSQIGFKGFGFFVVSYGFLGNVLGLVLTHVIIMLQFKTSHKC